MIKVRQKYNGTIVYVKFDLLSFFSDNIVKTPLMLHVTPEETLKLLEM